ncbi:hypothetical protein RIF29_37682 [Crotalaria pallida]|uniref:Late embryogenesis abundant protein LEA-2 subgroup domain-containing protein n=1 Tax=Crotalaria pallida TaxID=3830 RepID=A0AAN9HZ99_CROPI
MACSMRCSKGLKICCGVTFILIILLIVILVVLFFTVFKPKGPTITLQSVKLQGFEFEFPEFQLNVSLGIMIKVNNPNYGGFSYQSSTSYLNYRGNLVAEALIHEDTIPSHGALNISTTLNILGDDLSKFQGLPGDYFKGVINFTSTTTLPGKVRILKIIKFKAISYSTCDLSIFVQVKSVNSTCNTRLKL